MLFNSFTYAIFLPIVFLLYWFVFGAYAPKWLQHIYQRHEQLLGTDGYRLQNLMVVIASYIFYGWWDWRFLGLIALTSLLSWGSGLLIERGDRRKLWLVFNILINLGILGLFKYCNFFVDSFCALFGIAHTSDLIRLILPVGISFYTFQALSYSIDVYRGKIAATRDMVAFFAYVSFFPQLVAGPIERATNLLPQFTRPRTFSYNEAVDGMRRILWGLFKKVVVADNCALYVDRVWEDYASQSGSTLALAAVLFAVQIYGDFSGYSDIAIGSARLFGIRLMDNFRMPYQSRNVAEFWKRWHISLNTWFVDYVYIPLGGSREGRWRTIRNTFVIFLLSGLWHGANWTYVCWGLYHALLFVPLILMGRTKAYTGTASWREIPQMLLTFVLVTIGWIIFRAPCIADAWGYVVAMCDDIVSFPYLMNRDWYIPTFLVIGFLFIIEWMNRRKEHALSLDRFDSLVGRHVIYIILVVLLALFGGSTESFIYFQF